MNRRTLIKAFALTFSLTMVSFVLFAQGDKASRPSPPANAAGVLDGGQTVTIDYSSPAVKGRKIWGDLVPYDKAWRAGANEATIIGFDKDVMIGGTKVPAGKYSLFATPGQTSWTFTLNSQIGQWGITHTGDANFDASKNVATVTVTPEKSKAFNERLMYFVSKKGFELVWENVAVKVRVK